MTRDGTVSEVVNGVLTVISEGSGGKVDVVVLGTNEIQNTDTFIYQDKSNTGDPTNAKNNFILGQIAADANKTISRRRIDDIANGQLPAQPVDTLLSVTGTQSGSNFIPQATDGYGRTTGNYKLIKDSGVYGGSPFGFDTFAWTSNAIDFQEDIVRDRSFIKIPEVKCCVACGHPLPSEVKPMNNHMIALHHLLQEGNLLNSLWLCKLRHMQRVWY